MSHGAIGNPGNRLSTYLIAAVLLGFSVLAVSYSFVIPAWEAPDEAQHFRQVGYLIDHRRLPEGHDESAMAHHPPLYYLLLVPALLRVDRNGLDQVAGVNPDYRWADPNSGGHHAAAHDWETEQFPYSDLIRALHLSRISSVVCGMAAVFFSFRIGQALFGQKSFRAVGVAATVAFVPSFIFTSATVHPDSLVSALGAAALWRSLVFLNHPSVVNAVLLGILIGAMSLAKASGLLFVPLIPLVIGLTGHSGRWRQNGLRMVAGIAACLALAGPWLLRNRSLYGDFLGIGALVRNPMAFPPTGQPITPGLLAHELVSQWSPGSLLWHTLLLAFGYQDHYGPAWIYPVGYLVLVVAAFGLVRGGVVHRQHWRAWAPTAIVLGAALIAFALAAADFGASYLTGAHGRYLFPVLPVLAAVVIGGLRFLLPGHLLFVTGIVPVALVGLSLATPFALIAPTYALANQLTTRQSDDLQPNLDAVFGGRIALVRAEAGPARIEPGGEVTVRLHWRALQDVSRSYRILVQLMSPDGQALAQVDRVPAAGRASTMLWRIGDQIFDDFSLQVAPGTRPGLYQVTTGFYPLGDAGRLSVSGSAAAAGQVARIGTVKVLDSPTTPVGQPLAIFGEELGLLEVTYPTTAEARGEISVGLTWLAEGRPQRDYTVSLQALASDGVLVAQADSPPLGGWLPTSAWDPGDVIRDQVSLRLPSDAPSSLELQLIVYELETGRRLRVGLGDALTVGSLKVAG